MSSGAFFSSSNNIGNNGPFFRRGINIPANTITDFMNRTENLIKIRSVDSSANDGVLELFDFKTLDPGTKHIVINDFEVTINVPTQTGFYADSNPVNNTRAITRVVDVDHYTGKVTIDANLLLTKEGSTVNKLFYDALARGWKQIQIRKILEVIVNSKPITVPKKDLTKTTTFIEITSMERDLFNIIKTKNPMLTLKTKFDKVLDDQKGVADTMIISKETEMFIRDGRGVYGSDVSTAADFESLTKQYKYFSVVYGELVLAITDDGANGLDLDTRFLETNYGFWNSYDMFPKLERNSGYENYRNDLRDVWIPNYNTNEFYRYSIDRSIDDSHMFDHSGNIDKSFINDQLDSKFKRRDVLINSSDDSSGKIIEYLGEMEYEYFDDNDKNEFLNIANRKLNQSFSQESLTELLQNLNKGMELISRMSDIVYTETIRRHLGLFSGQIMSYLIEDHRTNTGVNAPNNMTMWDTKSSIDDFEFDANSTPYPNNTYPNEKNTNFLNLRYLKNSGNSKAFTNDNRIYNVDPNNPLRTTNIFVPITMVPMTVLLPLISLEGLRELIYNYENARLDLFPRMASLGKHKLEKEAKIAKKFLESSKLLHDIYLKIFLPDNIFLNENNTSTQHRTNESFSVFFDNVLLKYSNVMLINNGFSANNILTDATHMGTNIKNILLTILKRINEEGRSIVVAGGDTMGTALNIIQVDLDREQTRLVFYKYFSIFFLILQNSNINAVKNNPVQYGVLIGGPNLNEIGLVGNLRNVVTLDDIKTEIVKILTNKSDEYAENIIEHYNNQISGLEKKIEQRNNITNDLIDPSFFTPTTLYMSPKMAASIANKLNPETAGLWPADKSNFNPLSISKLKQYTVFTSNRTNSSISDRRDTRKKRKIPSSFLENHFNVNDMPLIGTGFLFNNIINSIKNKEGIFISDVSESLIGGKFKRGSKSFKQTLESKLEQHGEFEININELIKVLKVTQGDTFQKKIASNHQKSKNLLDRSLLFLLDGSKITKELMNAWQTYDLPIPFSFSILVWTNFKSKRIIKMKKNGTGTIWGLSKGLDIKKQELNEYNINKQTMNYACSVTNPDNIVMFNNCHITGIESSGNLKMIKKRDITTKNFNGNNYIVKLLPYNCDQRLIYNFTGDLNGTDYENVKEDYYDNTLLNTVGQYRLSNQLGLELPENSISSSVLEESRSTKGFSIQNTIVFPAPQKKLMFNGTEYVIDGQNPIRKEKFLEKIF